MPEQRKIIRLSRSLVVAIPPVLLEHLGVDRGSAVYWHRVRGGEAVLSARAERKGGHPEGLALARELDAARREIARLRQRYEQRDRSLYAEGYNVGYQKAQERLLTPHGKTAERQRRRQLYAYTFPEAAKAEPSRGRRRAPRADVVAGPDTYAAPAASEQPDEVEAPS